MASKATNNSAIKRSYLWHRRIGILVAVPILLIAVTGILLNHSKRLQLEEIYISNSFILNWYGMTPKTPIISAEADGLVVSLVEKSLYLNDIHLEQNSTAPTGVSRLGEFIVVSTEDAVLLLQRSGELVEKLGSESLPDGRILASRVLDGKFALDTTNGRYLADAELTQFVVHDHDALPLLVPQPLSAELSAKILRDWRGRGLNLARIVTDLHSGAIFGAGGTLLSDIVACCLILLVASGLFNWLKSTPK